jgi:hypothetical protein
MAREYWLLYKKRAEEFKDLAANSFPQVPDITYNPVSLIIDIDIALITKGLLITGTGEKYMKQNKFYLNIPEIVKNQLLDGNCFVDVVAKEEQVLRNGNIVKEQIIQYDVFSTDDVPEIEYDQRGNITRILLQGDGVSKEYYYNDEGVLKVKYTYDDDREDEDYPFIPGIIPVVEFPGVKTDNEDNVSRVEGISALLVDINLDKGKLDDIFSIHADPTLIGNVNFEETEDGEFNTEPRRAGQYNYMETPEGGKLYFLEMQGSVVQYLAAEKDKKKKELTLEYPELLLNDIAGGSSMSGYAIYLKILNLVSIIESYRAILVDSLHNLFEISTLLDGGIKNDTRIKLDPVVKYNENDRINQIVSSKNNDLIDHKTAVQLTAQLFGLPADEMWEKVSAQILEQNTDVNTNETKQFENQSIPNQSDDKKDTQL